MPLRNWAEIGNYYVDDERIADVGCGPSDILRYINPQKKPAFYLGIDLSKEYLNYGEIRARKLKLDSKFIEMNLNFLSKDQSVDRKFIDGLSENKISTVNLFGVLHHIDDQSVIATLDAVYSAGCVRSVNTQDVLINDNAINNFFVKLDRGEHVRTEAQYDELLGKTKWNKIEKLWTRAGLHAVRYIHYKLLR